jgi:outer membrane protein TolC
MTQMRRALIGLLALALLLLGLLRMNSAQAETLAEIYDKARGFEPSFQAALYEKSVNDMDVTIARSAYYPTGNVSVSRPAGSDTTEKAVSVRQPLVDLGAWTRLKKAEPSRVIAEATFAQREHELASRVYTVVSELVRLQELVRLSENQTDALQRQVLRAEESYARGRGTITEVRNTQVRLEQAKGNAQLLAVQLQVARRQYKATVGEDPPALGFAASYEPRNPKLVALEEALARAQSDAPESRLAAQRRALAELTLRERTSDFIPNVSWVAEQRWRDGSDSDLFTGVNVSIPFGVSVANVLGRRKAALQVDQARESARDVEQRTRIRVEALHAFVASGFEELAIRRNAIEVAELSAEANVQSFEAGLVSSIDVINALLAVFEVRKDYLTALLKTGQQVLDLHLTAALPPKESLDRVQSLVMAGPALAGSLISAPTLRSSSASPTPSTLSSLVKPQP